MQRTGIVIKVELRISTAFSGGKPSIRRQFYAAGGIVFFLYKTNQEPLRDFLTTPAAGASFCYIPAVEPMNTKHSLVEYRLDGK